MPREFKYAVGIQSRRPDQKQNGSGTCGGSRFGDESMTDEEAIKRTERLIQEEYALFPNNFVGAALYEGKRKVKTFPTQNKDGQEPAD